LTNVSAVSATSRQPLSMVKACRRPGISTNSVTPGFFFCRVLLSRHDEHRPALDVLVIDLGFGPGVDVGERGLEERLTRRSHRVPVEELLGLVVADRVGEGVVELLEGQWDGSMLVARVRQDRAGDRRAEIGSGTTPQKGAASIATVAAESPLPATIWANSTPNECPITAGFLSNASITEA
jgi:hypothetical protein